VDDMVDFRVEYFNTVEDLLDISVDVMTGLTVEFVFIVDDMVDFVFKFLEYFVETRVDFLDDDFVDFIAGACVDSNVVFVSI
jgi:hypothetical protein